MWKSEAKNEEKPIPADAAAAFYTAAETGWPFLIHGQERKALSMISKATTRFAR
jgi:hypothetical protein